MNQEIPLLFCFLIIDFLNVIRKNGKLVPLKKKKIAMKINKIFHLLPYFNSNLIKILQVLKV
jgi:hypothetical protein